MAWQGFSGSIPHKFEHKLRRHQQGFGKITPAAVLDKIIMVTGLSAVFSPGRGLAGFPQEKLKWRIKTNKMRPLGRRGKLQVNQTYVVLMVNLTLKHSVCLNKLIKKHDIKWVKVFNFVAFTFIGPTHVPLHGKLLLRIVNTSSAILDQVGTSCNRQFGERAQVRHTACFL